jgi:hypothetical protein
LLAKAEYSRDCRIRFRFGGCGARDESGGHPVVSGRQHAWADADVPRNRQMSNTEFCFFFLPHNGCQLRKNQQVPGLVNPEPNVHFFLTAKAAKLKQRTRRIFPIINSMARFQQSFLCELCSFFADSVVKFFSFLF